MEPASSAHKGGFGGVGRGRWIYGVGQLWGHSYRVGQLWGNLLCGAALEGICVGNLGASTVWVNSDLPNTMCFKEASLKQEKEGKSGPQTP